MPFCASCCPGIWSSPLPRETQLRCLTLVYSLLLTYATVWQNIDLPPRAAESERAVVAAAALALFDKVGHSLELLV